MMIWMTSVTGSLIPLRSRISLRSSPVPLLVRLPVLQLPELLPPMPPYPSIKELRIVVARMLRGINSTEPLLNRSWIRVPV